MGDNFKNKGILHGLVEKSLSTILTLKSSKKWIFSQINLKIIFYKSKKMLLPGQMIARMFVASKPVGNWKRLFATRFSLDELNLSPMNSIFVRFSILGLMLFASFSKLSAQCTSNAGFMVLTPINACGTESVTAQYAGGQFLDSNDAMQFVLHTNAGPVLGVVLAENSTPQFDYNILAFYGVTYYISAIVGNDLGGGNVDLADPCLSVSTGTPVTWHQPPTATMDNANYVVCAGDSTPVTATIFFTGTPPWNLTYIDNGLPITLNIPSNPFSLDFFWNPSGNSINCLEGVSDANGCSGTVNGCVTINTPPFICNADVIQPDCGGQSNGSIAINCTGGSPPYQYLWSNGATESVATNLSNGTYFVSIIDAAGCSSQNVFTIASGPDILCTPNISGSINCNNSEATILMTCSGGTGGFNYLWYDPNNNLMGNGPSQVVNSSGTYTVVITDFNGCFDTVNVDVPQGIQECGTITGTVTSEEDGNCTYDTSEPALSNWMVRATATNGDEYFDFTDSLGNYAMQAPPDDYTVEAIPPAAYWSDCGSTINLTLEDAIDVDTADFHWLKTITCPLMEVDISTPLLRRCLNNFYYVNFCNNGSETAVGASIEVTLDPLISIISASLPFTGPVNDVYTFEIGDVDEGECGSFYFLAHVSCDAVLGQTLCAEAHIYPDSLCTPIDPNWSGAILEITSNCTADSVIFTITNTGTGDMDEPQGFIVVEDGVMLLQSDFELGAGESITVSFAANGSTYNLLAEQVAGEPGFSVLSQFVEGCGTNGSGTFSTGFASQFPEDDNGPFVSIDCHDVIGSYDPNDKQGYPLGYGDEHLIEPGQMLDYHIRFQNTGTDTAFLVVIQDVIDPSLDIATLRPGASSHPYQLDIHQDTLVFIFENILLPDSNVNEQGSHGFVKFSIGQKAGLPLGTVIENEAAIFFDFNDPVITNSTVHKLGEHFIASAVQPPVFPKKINCTVYPNPFADEAVVLLQGVENQEIELRLFDLTGRFLRSEKIKNGVGKIKKNGLASGLYFFEITANGMAVGQGKVAVQ